MAAPKTTIWDMPELTPIKHRVLRTYLERTLPLLLPQHERIYLLDSFCGPGQYTHGEDGSPLIAIDTLLACTSNLEHLRKVTLLFMDKDKRRCYHLHSLLERRRQKQPGIANINYYIERGNFAHKLHNRLLVLEKSGKPLPPTFAFIDPFGFSDTPMATIARLMRHQRCEMLLTLNYEETNRFLTHPGEPIQHHLTALFGAEHAIDPAGDREQQFCAFYCTQLCRASQVKYVCIFRLKNMQNATDYFLVFSTHQRANLERMKDIFWEIDPFYGDTFSAYEHKKHAHQLYLIPPEPDYDLLTRQLSCHLRGSTLTISDLEEYILAETTFRAVGYREHVLCPLERAARIHITSSNPLRRSGEYAETDQIHFL